MTSENHVEPLDIEAAVPYGVRNDMDYAVAVIGVGGEIKFNFTPEELRSIADDVEESFEEVADD